MKITIIGTGFVGVVTAGVLAHLKNQVKALDIDPNKIGLLSQGKVPFFEPDLEALVNEGLSSGNLEFTANYEEAIKNAEIILISVGTPSQEDGQADLRYVLDSAKAMAPYLQDEAIVAIKSTVPPGTNRLVKEEIGKYTSKRFFVASLPEFLKEGTAVQDTLHPDRIVIGANEPQVIKKLLELHKPFNSQTVLVSPESAQMAKYAANAYLAQRITFINQTANLCEFNGADIQDVILAIGYDKRIGRHYWYPGLGYGGSCFPKDVKELSAYSRANGFKNGLFVRLDEFNEERITQFLKKLEDKSNGFKGKIIAVLGLSFKPNTDDIREAPALKIIPYLQREKAIIKAYDPKAIPVFQKLIPNIFYADDAYQAVQEADMVILLVEWPELVKLDLIKLKQLMRGNWFVDTRNQYDSELVKELGFNYIGIGKK